MKVFCCGLVSILILLISVIASHAQSSTSAILLLQPQGARGIALGESFVAVSAGMSSIYWNPAGLLAERQSLQLSYSHRPELFRDFLNYEYGVIGYQFGQRLALAATFNYTDVGRTTFDFLDTYAYAAGVTISTRVWRDLSGGLTLKRISHHIEPRTAHAYAADFGILYSLNEVPHPTATNGVLRLGASFSNLGEKIEFFEGQGESLPQFLRIGFAYDLSSERTWQNTALSNLGLLISFEYQNLLNEQEEENIWEWGGGVELRFLEIVAFRLGYHERHPKTRATLIGKTLETGASIGFGLNLPLNKFNTSLPLVLQFDFASAPQNGFVENYQMYTFAVNWEL
jgi:opacity protein-like surface antigen